MRTESTFLISKIHQLNGLPCQDYAAHTEDSLYLSDGCSTSPNTDIGSRIITRSAMDLCRHTDNLSIIDPLYHNCLNKLAKTACVSMGMSFMETMRATHLKVHIGSGLMNLTICGDGYFAKKKLDGSLVVFKVFNRHNMPFYPASYLEENLEDESKLFDTVLETYSYDPDLNLTSTHTRDLTESETMYGWSKLFSLGEIHSIGIFSDGVDQVQDMDAVHLINSLLSIKNTTKGFLHRRINKLISKENLLERLEDDFSCGIAIL